MRSFVSNRSSSGSCFRVSSTFISWIFEALSADILLGYVFKGEEGAADLSASSDFWTTMFGSAAFAAENIAWLSLLFDGLLGDFLPFSPHPFTKRCRFRGVRDGFYYQ